MLVVEVKQEGYGYRQQNVRQFLQCSLRQNLATSRESITPVTYVVDSPVLRLEAFS